MWKLKSVSRLNKDKLINSKVPKYPCLGQGIYNRSGIKCKNDRLEIALQIIDFFYLVD